MADEDVFKAQGFGQSLPPGPRSALLVIDFVNSFADPALFGGGNIGPAIQNTRILLDEARRASLPVCFSRIVYQSDGADLCVFQMKAPRLALLTEESPLSAVVNELRPVSGELVLAKRSPSAFFGTDLSSWLIARGVQNLIVSGCTTSGCVRATVVEGVSYNFRCFVVDECVGDRSLQAHVASLFDIRQKYGDVWSIEAAKALMAREGAARASA